MEKLSNEWHKSMYGQNFIDLTIGAKDIEQTSRQQVDFLYEVLRLQPGSTVLDVPCGAGRHSIYFAKKNCQVIGIDINRICLKSAREKNAHKNIRYKVGNMADLSDYRKSFDAVVNLFTSFGYFATDKQNESVLRQMAKALKPGGQIALSVIDRDWLMRVWDPFRWWEKKGFLLFNGVKYDKKSKYIEGYFIFVNKRTSKANHHYFRHRLYSRNEMIRLMRACGLKKIKVFGGFEMEDYKKGQSHHPVYIGQK